MRLALLHTLSAELLSRMLPEVPVRLVLFFKVWCITVDRCAERHISAIPSDIVFFFGKLKCLTLNSWNFNDFYFVCLRSHAPIIVDFLENKISLIDSFLYELLFIMRFTTICESISMFAKALTRECDIWLGGKVWPNDQWTMNIWFDMLPRFNIETCPSFWWNFGELRCFSYKTMAKVSRASPHKSYK